MAKGLSPGDDERTALESPWEEEEASTTIAKSESGAPGRPVAHEAKPTTSLTQTRAGFEEPTVDDQKAHVPSAAAPTRAAPRARLVVTEGNDAGLAHELQPGTMVTIGRAIDNDVVLTDISVSRKHFDLKFEAGSWLIVDRGSGNGTVVNGNLEDHAFALAHGDVIEIGNTVFRFELPDAPADSPARTYDLDEDEEEISTFANLPAHAVQGSTARELPRPAASAAGAQPAASMPLPASTAPMRPRAGTSPPGPSTAAIRPRAGTLPPPESTAPMRARAGMPPAAAAGLEATEPLLPSSTLPMPQMANRAPIGATESPTMHGDSMGLPITFDLSGSSPVNHVPTTLPGHAGPQVARAAYPYPGASEHAPYPAHTPYLHIQAEFRRHDGSTAHAPPLPYDARHRGASASLALDAPRLSRRTKLVIAGLGLAILTGVVTAAVVKSDATARGARRGVASATAGTTSGPGAPSQTAPTVQPIESGAADAPRDQPGSAAPSSGQGQVVVATQAAATQAAATQATTTSSSAQVTRQDSRRNERRSERRTTSKPEPKRVATGDIAGSRQKAEALYRDRKFNDAANVLFTAAKTASPADARSLRLSAEMYAQFGKVFSRGLAPAEKPSTAFDNLQKALNYDDNLGQHFTSDLRTRLVQVAPKAAVSFLTQQEYSKARTAVITAQRLGSTDSNLPVVKQRLEAVAGEMYAQAAKEIGSNPGAAKEKLRQVKAMVDAKSPWAIKAQQLLDRS